jgi:two-component system sensor histidine kinase UhpB
LTFDIRAVWQRLQRWSLFYKILFANSAIVGLGAVAGTFITLWHVSRFPDDVHYELIAVFTLFGVLISFVVNRWVLKQALRPLGQLQTAVDQVRQGETEVHITLGTITDEQFERLVDTFNQMLIEHEQHTYQMAHLPRQILQAQEEERQRLARELHDEAAQALTSLLVNIRLLERAHDPEKAQQQVRMLRELTAQALEEVRRVALDLRPTILDDLGLAAALEWRADEFRQASDIATTVEIVGLETRLPREIELVFYRVGQEALTNIARHAEAREVTLTLRREDQQLSLEIKDDGCGFILETIPHDQAQGLGLLGMRERLAMIAGHLTIEAAPGQGTRILAQAPLERN